MSSIKNKIAQFIFTSLSICLLTCCNQITDSTNKGQVKGHNYVFEAENASFTNAEEIQLDEDKKASNNRVVGFLKDDSELTFNINVEEKGEIPLTIRLSSPMGWIGVYCLPQTFDFDKLYTLSINDVEIEMNKRLYGSSDVAQHYNYYYWQSITKYIEFEQGNNVVSLKLTNREKRVYASYGNVDYISIFIEDSPSIES